METFQTKTKLQIPLILFKISQQFNVFCLKCNLKQISMYVNYMQKYIEFQVWIYRTIGNHVVDYKLFNKHLKLLCTF